jgi:hypothetical protein
MHISHSGVEREAKMGGPATRQASNVDNRRRGWARTQESLRRVGSLGRTLSEDLLAILGVSLAMILEQLLAVGAVVPA